MINSLHNPQIKQLVRLKRRSSRAQSNAFCVEGGRECLRAIEAGFAATALYFCEELSGPDEKSAVEAGRAHGIRVEDCVAPVIAKASLRDSPSGLIGLFEVPEMPAFPQELPDNPLVVICDSLEKPGNLGAIIRTAEAAGASAVAIPDAVTDPFSPNTIRNSRGAVFSIPIILQPADAVQTWLKANGMQVVVASPEASSCIWNEDLSGPVALVVGTEHDGVSPFWKEVSNLRVRIPIEGESDSLNVSVAAAVLVYEVLRQRDLSSR